AQQLLSFEEVVASLELGNHVMAIFDGSNCDDQFPPKFSFEPALLIPLDPWTRIQLEDGSEDFVTFNHEFIFYDGDLVAVTGSLDDMGNASFVLHEISGLDGSLKNSTVAECTLNVGAFFFERIFVFPKSVRFWMELGAGREHITTYDDLKSQLLGGTHVTFVGLVELCEGNPTTGVSKAQGGGYHFQFYIESDPNNGQEDIILEYDYLGVSMDGSTPTFNVVRMRVYPDGFVNVTGNSFLTTTWDDEYPFPEGFQCTLDVGTRFQYRRREPLH
ncbi:unnamed protein product, partial [Darwinula stevensoni]